MIFIKKETTFTQMENIYNIYKFLSKIKSIEIISQGTKLMQQPNKLILI